MQNDKPLIVQSDKTLLLDVHAPKADECRNDLIPFAELERSPEYLHTYRLTPLSLWNAASAGFTADDIAAVLKRYSRFDVPQSVIAWMRETAERFGKLRLVASPSSDAEEYLKLETDSERIYRELCANRGLAKYLSIDEDGSRCFRVRLTDRGTVKQELIKTGWPVKDEVPLADGEVLDIRLQKTTSNGSPLVVREYQLEAAKALVGDKGPGTGFGTIVLPCGAGKTIVGMQIMDMLKTSTLIVTTNITAVHQWIAELIDKTNLTADDIAEYTGAEKSIKPVTVATYQILTWRPEKDGPYPHFSLFRKRAWGLILYDEVHMLPAPVFRVVAELQAVRRVGLTATLVREDGCESYVFSLVGPKRYDVPWKELEQSGWIASAECIEVRLDLDADEEIRYAVANARTKHRIASENPIKDRVVREIVDRFPNDKILVIGQYIDQLEKLARMLHAPIITGKTPVSERDAIYGKFRSGKLHVLVVSKVANFAIDLPDASLAIQVSGTFGSRQEEAQRLGRILRPKERTARFFTLITRNTVEEDFGANRQKFLAEQGYSYRIVRYRDESDFDEITEEGLC
ncbi:DNA repair helicase XPB [Treponema socranskii]|uniref:DNA repair helicase XPB n=1 Tax=Treponema socranskii TaxID=53419 RepID=UPI00287134FA|nr:DNA repair helicase XPB [Treponema socranskii]MDR9860034.1 DEAD/DEAH box helicase [Treponema socranskii]